MPVSDTLYLVNSTCLTIRLFVRNLLFPLFPLLSSLLQSQIMSGEQQSAFALFDKKGDEKVSVNDVGMLLRSLGQNPSEAAVRKIQSDLGGGECCFHVPASLLLLSFLIAVHPTCIRTYTCARSYCR